MLIATAGHVDHGKTTLIKALTGTDTDRLAEEKKRGLTIELGFAYIPGPDGTTLGFIDVPGHHKFVRTMASGVAGIDLALLVVAADDGIMSQTREHIAILDLLGIDRCLVALTYVDRVSAERVSEVSKQISDYLSDTSLSFANELRCIPVSVPQQIGVSELEVALFDCARESLEQKNVRPKGHYFRLAVDRSFSLRGAGTIATGTVMTGAIAESDAVTILSASDGFRSSMKNVKTSRVRSMHIDGAAASKTEFQQATTGQRAALNLAAVDTDEVSRGSWITSADIAVMTSCADVELQLLPSEKKSLRHWTSAHLYTGSAAINCRIALYDIRSLAPGTKHFAQLVLNAPHHLLYGDRFVIRDQSATRVLGGGMVIDPFASRHRSFRKQRATLLLELLHQDPLRALQGALAISKTGLPAEEFRLGRNLSPDQFVALLEGSGIVDSTDASGKSWLLRLTDLQAAQDLILDTIKQFHLQNQSSLGPHSEAVKSALQLAGNVFEMGLSKLLLANTIRRSNERLFLASHVPRLADEDKALLDQLSVWIQADNLKPPALADLASKLDVERADLINRVKPLLESGNLVLISTNRLYSPQALETLVDIAYKLCQESAEGFDAKTFRDVSGIGRNLTIDVLEYFDRQRVTRRVGDYRVVS